MVLPERRCRPTRTADRGPPPNCSTSSRATTGASTTCARCSTSSSTDRTGSRCSPSSAGRSSARWPTWADIRWRWWPTSRRCWPARSTPTRPTRPRTSSSVADSFHLPIVFLADNPGMLPGSRSERSGVLRSGARMFAAQTSATTLKLHVTLRKAYGFGSMVMSLLGFDDQVATFAYPGATMGAMSAAALSRATNAEEDLSRQAARRRTAGVLPVGRTPGVRRTHRPARDPRRAAFRAAARTVRAPGRRRAGQPYRHPAVSR